MAHSHSNAARSGRGAARLGPEALHEGAEHQVTAAELYRHRRALRILIVALLAHAYAAFALWSRANGARPNRYAVKKAVGSSCFSSPATISASPR